MLLASQSNGLLWAVAEAYGKEGSATLTERHQELRLHTFSHLLQTLPHHLHMSHIESTAVPFNNPVGVSASSTEITLSEPLDRRRGLLKFSCSFFGRPKTSTIWSSPSTPYHSKPRATRLCAMFSSTTVTNLSNATKRGEELYLVVNSL
jgi:hypothetical protein